MNNDKQLNIKPIFCIILVIKSNFFKFKCLNYTFIMCKQGLGIIFQHYI